MAPPPGLYTKKFTQGLTVEVPGFELPVTLPDMPPKAQILNFGKKPLDQKFVRTEVPADIWQWEEHKRSAWVAAEWHKRINGVWIYIKGDPYYITGAAYYFFNYWHTEQGGLPEFRMEAVQWYWVWDMVERDPMCLGLLDFKGRRVGETEKALSALTERVTRYRNSVAGMQNIGKDDAQKNFDRLVNSFLHLPFFFRPRYVGDERADPPRNRLDFRLPTSLPDELRKFDLKSKITFKPTKYKMYDGWPLRVYYLDEPGKISPTEGMHVEMQWGVVRLCLVQKNGKKVVGKAIWTSTIESSEENKVNKALETQDSIEICKKMWDDSDPRELNDNGQTNSGLWRIFRGYELGADIDEWGFHKVEEAQIFRANEIASLEKKKDFAGITRLKRRLPASIDDAFLPPDGDCKFNEVLLDEQITRVEQQLLSGQHWPNRPIRGNLVWTKGFLSDVAWVPTEGGRWEISGHPEKRNARDMRGGFWVPRNTAHFATGVDPIDHEKPEKGGSDAAIAVMAMYDPLREERLLYDEHGQVENVWDMVTDRCVCTYLYRHQSPYDFFDDVVKTMVYYGSKVNIENVRGGLIAYLTRQGLSHYMSRKPAAFDPKAMRTGKEDPNFGTTASPDMIATYVEEIQEHVLLRSRTYTHLDLLRDMRKYNGEKKNRTKRDLTVAWGQALLLGNSQRIMNEKREKRKTQRREWVRVYNQHRYAVSGR